MKTKVKISIQWIVMTGALMISTFSFNANLYADSPKKHKLVRSDSERIGQQIDKIESYLELLETADEKQAAAIHRKIEFSQTLVKEREDNLFDEANMKKAAMVLPYSKYNFDVAENSLAVSNFKACRNGNLKDFHLGFKTAETGKAKVDIVSPGGELLKSISIADYDGSFEEEIKLSAAKGDVYFVHVTVDGKQTTKKLRFE